MSRRDVARVTHARHACLQQLRVAGAMRFMAVCAVFHHRRVFPQEGAAPLRVAAQAVLVGRALNKLLRIRCAMRIMAARAGHLSFAVGHVRRALQLGAPHLVAL